MTENERATPTEVTAKPENPTATLAEFLANTPPYTKTVVSDFWVDHGNGHKRNRPRILLHCPNEKCRGKGKLSFGLTANASEKALATTRHITYEYRCSNCQESLKIFTFLTQLEWGELSLHSECTKLGEFPPYGPPIPSQLMKMVGSDRELFLKGRRCETQGLGIASFAYYRRVIEDQRDRLFNQVIEATKLLEPESALIAELEHAKKEKQFTKSIDGIKTAIPQGLMISGHNPLTLLHSALSEGLHAQSDEECLEIAGEVRIVLTKFAEKLTEARNENKEVQDAVRKLAQRRQQAKEEDKTNKNN